MEIKYLSSSLCQEQVENSRDDDVNRVSRDGPLNIVDVNDDCLEAIFINLSLKQLFDVAICHRRFLTATRRAFLKNFKHNEITIVVCQTIHSERPEIFNLLGDIMQSIRITYDRYNSLIGHVANRSIHNAIVRYCSDTLTAATFNHIQPEMTINRPFRQLRVLNFNHGCVGRTMSEFNKYFPQLNSLQFFFCKTENTRCIEHTFVNLHHFTAAHHNFTFHNLRIFLDRNTQLKTFTIYNYDRQLIGQLDEYTRNKFKSLTTKFETYPCYFAFDFN